jgi:hypothetical protein
VAVRLGAHDGHEWMTGLLNDCHRNSNREMIPVCCWVADDDEPGSVLGSCGCQRTFHQCICSADSGSFA